MHFLQVRAQALKAVRQFFEARNYLEVETPNLVPSPGLDVHLTAFEVHTKALPKEPRYLITSPEYQMKRLLAAGLPKIFQIARCFRQEEHGTWHNSEFTMIEWYQAHASFDALIAETESLVVTLAQTVRGRADVEIASGVHSNAKILSLNPPFERLPVMQAFARYTKFSAEQALTLALSTNPDDEERYFRIWVDEVEPGLAESEPVVLIEFPVTQASLARVCKHDSRFAERFELVIGGIELCNGFGELVDAHEQRCRFLHDQQQRTRLGLPVYPLDEKFLLALELGLPQCVGNALGFDRLLALIVGAKTIADVMAFSDATI